MVFIRRTPLIMSARPGVLPSHPVGPSVKDSAPDTPATTPPSNRHPLANARDLPLTHSPLSRPSPSPALRTKLVPRIGRRADRPASHGLYDVEKPADAFQMKVSELLEHTDPIAIGVLMVEGIALILLGVALVTVPMLAHPDGLFMSTGKDSLSFLVIGLPTLAAGVVAVG